jgi:hypothetical protein
MKNVRVDTTDMKVYRKYVKIRSGKIAGTYWKLVDYKTTHELEGARVCPPEHLKRLLKTAF